MIAHLWKWLTLATLVLTSTSVGCVGGLGVDLAGGGLVVWAVKVVRLSYVVSSVKIRDWAT